MIFKLIGAVLVMVSASLIGCCFAECMVSRERELANLADAVLLMSDQLGYTLEPVKQLFLKVSPNTKGKVSLLFDKISALVDDGFTAGEAWCGALETLAPVMSLKKSDCEYISNCSDAFLAYDASQQKLQLQNLSERIRALAFEAGEEKRKNCKLVRMLGIYGGVMICAILF